MPTLDYVCLLRATWIIDLASKTWKKLASNHNDHRYGHTGSLGLSNDVVIVSGCKGDRTTCQHNFSLMLEPLSLQQMAVKTVYKHRRELKYEKALPKTLLKRFNSLVTTN